MQFICNFWVVSDQLMALCVQKLKVPSRFAGLDFAAERIWCVRSACCLQTGPLWTTFCVVSDLLGFMCWCPKRLWEPMVRWITEHLNWPVSPPHHTLMAQGRIFSGAHIAFEFIPQLSTGAVFTDSSEIPRANSPPSQFHNPKYASVKQA